MEKLNIPIELLKRYKGSKADKELLAFSIAIKSTYSNSVLTNISISKVMTVFHVSHNKAKSLIDRAKSSELFTYDAKRNILLANTYKDNTTKRSKNGKLKYKSDFCYKIDKKFCFIKRIVFEINRMLILNAVNAVERDNLTSSSIKQTTNRCACSRDLTLRKLSNISGISKSEAHRILTALYEGGTLNKTSIHMVMIMPVVNETTVTEWRKATNRNNFILNPNDNSGWIVVPTSYTINDRNETNRLKHVIYTHRKRVGTTSINRTERIHKTNTADDFYNNPRNAAWS